MFDLRYHVASLAAVFVALVLGIFVGVGLSGRGFVSDAERENLQSRIAELGVERDDAVARAQAAGLRGTALDDYARTSYPDLVRDRLDGRSVGVVFVGSVDQGVAETVRRAVDDAGGRVATFRALRVPLDDEAIDAALGADPATRELAGPDNREQLGRALARELVTAGPDPVLDRVAAELVEEQSGAGDAGCRRRRRRAAGAAAGRRDADLPRRALRRARRGAAPGGRRRPGGRHGQRRAGLPPERPRDGERDRRRDGAGRARLPPRGRPVGELRAGGERRGRRPARSGDGQAAGQGVTERLTVLVAARDEEARIGDTVAALRAAFPHAEVVVADDGSRDGTAARAPRPGRASSGCRAAARARR